MDTGPILTRSACESSQPLFACLGLVYRCTLASGTVNNAGQPYEPLPHR